MSFDDNFTKEDREMRFHAKEDRLGPGRILAEAIIADIRRDYRLDRNKLSKTYCAPLLGERGALVAHSIVRSTYPGYEFLEIEPDSEKPNCAQVTMLW